MIIRIHSTDPDGRPVECTGDYFIGETALEIVEGMMLNPFTTDADAVAYMRRILAVIGQEGATLPSKPDAAAEAFLSILVAAGFAAWETKEYYEKFGRSVGYATLEPEGNGENKEKTANKED